MLDKFWMFIKKFEWKRSFWIDNSGLGIMQINVSIDLTIALSKDQIEEVLLDVPPKSDRGDLPGYHLTHVSYQADPTCLRAQMIYTEKAKPVSGNKDNITYEG